MNALRFPVAATLLAWLLLVPTTGLRAADAGKPVGTVVVPAGLKLAEVREVVVVSLVQRNWTVKEKTDDRAVGYLNHRGIEATLTLTFDTHQVSLFCEGWKVDKAGKRLKPEMPDGWIANMKKDVTKRLNLAAAKK